MTDIRCGNCGKKFDELKRGLVIHAPSTNIPEDLKVVVIEKTCNRCHYLNVLIYKAE